MHTCIIKSFIILILLVQCSFSKDLNEILNDEYIRVGVKYDYRPFGFISENGRLEGFDIDLIKSMMDKLGLRVKFIEVSSKNKERMLVEGKVDIVLSGIIEDSAEYKNLIYTKPYYLDEQVVLVNKGKNINNINDLKSMHIGSIKGSNSMSNFLKIQPDVFSISFSEYPQLIKALTNNNIDAITAGSSWAKEQVKLFDNKFKILNIIVCNNKYSIALKKGNDSLRDKLNSLFVSITTDNTYEKIYKKWFK